MKRRNFLRMSGVLASLPTVNIIASQSKPSQAMDLLVKNIYEWCIYTLNDQGQILDDYYRKSIKPVLGKFGVKIGAFKLFKEEEKNMRYFLHIYNNWELYIQSKSAMWKDKLFLINAQSFFDNSAVNPVYSEYQTFLCEAFDKQPFLLQPSTERTLFEFRNYKSPNDEANKRKIMMFETEEIALFNKIGINSVCYGNVLAGPRMPSLIYLTWSKDEATRNEAWKKFGESQEWKTMRDKPEYANTATDNKVVLLSPLDYSDI